jgi:antitoxin ParD1/3/4
MEADDMTMRASLSITEPNEKWIQEKIRSREFSSRSDVVNDLIRKAREIEMIRHRLIAAELAVQERGFSIKSPDEILETSKKTV